MVGEGDEEPCPERLQRRKRASSAGGEIRQHPAFAADAPAGSSPHLPEVRRLQRVPRHCMPRPRSAIATAGRRPTTRPSAARAPTRPGARWAGCHFLAHGSGRGRRWDGAPKGPASAPSTCPPAARWSRPRVPKAVQARRWPLANHTPTGRCSSHSRSATPDREATPWCGTRKDEPRRD
eukprot:scaffold19911_cov59-Phaeocystis_antarctica.AAC.12